MSSIFVTTSEILSRQTEEEIPYEDASKLYRIIPRFSLPGNISRSTALRLLREHPSDVEWTTEMFSWFTNLFGNPWLCDEELGDNTPDVDSEFYHILYLYPCLAPMFRLYRSVNSTSSLDNEYLKKDFPLAFEEYELTLEEKALLRVIIYTDALTLEEEQSIVDYHFKHLIGAPATKTALSSSNLRDILSKIIEVRDSGISEESFQKYLKLNRDDNRLMYFVLNKFLSRDCDTEDHHYIGEILSLYPHLRDIGRMIIKHGNYARIATDDRLMSYLLNIPFRVFLDRKILIERLDCALSDLSAHQENIVQTNKAKANEFIRDSGLSILDVKINIPFSYYSYPTGELVFVLINNELTCYTRVNNVDRDESNYGYVQLCLLDCLSLVDRDVINICNLNVTSLFEYYSRPDYYIKEVERLLAEKTKSK